MHLDELSRATRVLEAVNPRRRGFFGLFGGVDWIAVIKIVLEILRRLGYLNAESVRAGDGTALPLDVMHVIDREFPRS